VVTGLTPDLGDQEAVSLRPFIDHRS
jgi:hypothetical protein